MYRLTFSKLYIPLLALTQLYIAYYRLNISRFMNLEMDMPRSWVLIYRQVWVSFAFGLMAIVSGKSFRVPFRKLWLIMITGIIHISLAQQLFIRAQLTNGPFITAWYQPIVPAIVTLAAVILKYEVGTTFKYIGIAIWLIASLSRLFRDMDIDQGSNGLFNNKFYLFLQVLFLGLGVLLQK